jgi:hypothetical protein
MNQDSTDDTRDTLVDHLKPYSDDELDHAMRELLALEARERGQHSRGLLRAFSRVFASLGLAVALSAPGLAAAQDAPAKPKRPTMCLQGQPVEAKGGFMGFLCTDGKRPRILVRYTVVQFVNEAGDGAVYVLGWPTAAKGPKMTPVLGGMKL